MVYLILTPIALCSIVCAIKSRLGGVRDIDVFYHFLGNFVGDKVQDLN